MNGLPEEILRCFRADFTEHLTYEELQHLHLLNRTFEKKEKVHKITNNFMAFVKEMWPAAKNAAEWQCHIGVLTTTVKDDRNHLERLFLQFVRFGPESRFPNHDKRYKHFQDWS